MIDWAEKRGVAKVSPDLYWESRGREAGGGFPFMEAAGGIVGWGTRVVLNRLKEQKNPTGVGNE